MTAPDILTEEEDTEVIPGFLTTNQAARRYGIKPNSWVWNIRRGRVEGARKLEHIWLLPVESCEEFIRTKQSWWSANGGKSGRDRLRRKQEVAAWRKEQEEKEDDRGWAP